MCPVLLTEKCYNSCAPQDDSSIMKWFFKRPCVLKLLRTSVLPIQLYKTNAAVEVQCHVNLPRCVCAYWERNLCCSQLFQTTLLFRSVATDGVGLGWYQQGSVSQFSCVFLQALHTLWAEQYRVARAHGCNSGCIDINFVLLLSSVFSGSL